MMRRITNLLKRAFLTSDRTWHSATAIDTTLHDALRNWTTARAQSSSEQASAVVDLTTIDDFPLPHEASATRGIASNQRVETFVIRGRRVNLRLFDFPDDEHRTRRM